MNLLLIRQEELQDNSAVISDGRAKHIISNLKSEVGDTLRAGVVGGMIGFADISAISDAGVSVSFRPERKPPIPPLIYL